MRRKSPPFGIELNGSDMQGQHAGEILPVNLSDGEFIGCREILSRKMPRKIAREIATVREKIERQ
jgi:hypothetical protein